MRSPIFRFFVLGGAGVVPGDRGGRVPPILRFFVFGEAAEGGGGAVVSKEGGACVSEDEGG